MRRTGRQRRTWAAVVRGVVGLLTLLPAHAEAQGPGPVIIPGLPGAGLQAGARPSPNAWPYTDLPGGKPAAPTDTTDEAETVEIPPSAAPPYGVTGGWFGARDALFDDGDRPPRRASRSFIRE